MWPRLAGHTPGRLRASDTETAGPRLDGGQQVMVVWGVRGGGLGAGGRDWTWQGGGGSSRGGEYWGYRHASRLPRVLSGGRSAPRLPFPAPLPLRARRSDPRPGYLGGSAHILLSSWWVGSCPALPFTAGTSTHGFHSLSRLSCDIEVAFSGSVLPCPALPCPRG